MRVGLGSVDILETILRSLDCIPPTTGAMECGVGVGGVRADLTHPTLGRRR